MEKTGKVCTLSGDGIDVRSRRFRIWEQNRKREYQQTSKNVAMVAQMMRDESARLLGYAGDDEVISDIVDSFVQLAEYIDVHLKE